MRRTMSEGIMMTNRPKDGPKLVVLAAMALLALAAAASGFLTWARAEAPPSVVTTQA